MKIAILAVGILAGLANLYTGGTELKMPKGSKRTYVIISYVAAGWMFSWAIFEGLLPLLGGK